jgi:acyl-CoA thioester hydrolase
MNKLDEYPVQVPLRVDWGDMDAFQHVNNVVYFRWFENARIAYFERAETLDGTIGPILAKTDCRFRAPLAYPDDIVVGCRVREVGTHDFIMEYAVYSKAKDVIAAKGEGRVVSYDYANNAKVEVPDAWRKKIGEIEGW